MMKRLLCIITMLSGNINCMKHMCKESKTKYVSKDETWSDYKNRLDGCPKNFSNKKALKEQKTCCQC